MAGKKGGGAGGKDDDAPLIDLNEASIKKLISKAKKKGYVTYDELNDALPQGEMSSDQIEDILGYPGRAALIHRDDMVL